MLVAHMYVEKERRGRGKEEKKGKREEISKEF